MMAAAGLTTLERRTAAAVALVGGDRARATRIAGAPAAYLSAMGSSDVARHAALLSPVPAPGRVRVVATPAATTGAWHLDMAARDRPGLLAVCTGVLADRGIDVVQAVLATWDDGAALEALVVRSPAAPDASSVRTAIEEALDQPMWSAPVAEAVVAFDPDASPLYTAAEMRATDRPGLLHDVAVAIAAAGVDVHAARITTTAGVACDRFDLSDGAGAKLRADHESAIRHHLRAGVALPRKRRWRR